MQSWRDERIRDYAAQITALQQTAALRQTTGAHIDDALAKELLVGAVCVGDAGMAQEIWRQRHKDAVWFQPLAAAPVMTLEQWCAANGAPCRVVEPSREVHVTPTSAHIGEFRYQTIPALFSSLPQAQWTAGHDFIVGSDGTVISDSGFHSLEYATSTHPHTYAPRINSVVYHRPDQEEYIDEDMIFLSGPNDGHFGHWFGDYLPRLLARNHCIRDAKIATLSFLTRTQKQTLVTMGVNLERVLRCEIGRRYKFRTLHFYKSGFCGVPNPPHVKFLREAISRHTKPTKGNRIFLARTSVGTRSVSNWDEFDAFLREAGFRVLDMANLTVEQQQKTLADAEILLGVFGSNLLALYFAPPGCKVICMTHQPEFMYSEYPWLAATAAFLHQEYQLLPCVKAEAAGKRKLKGDTDIVVDCQELRRRILG